MRAIGIDTEQMPPPETGITCANCATTIERGANRLEGAQSANVSCTTEGRALDPALAAAAMAIISVTVVSSSLRLRGFRVRE